MRRAAPSGRRSPAASPAVPPRGGAGSILASAYVDGADVDGTDVDGADIDGTDVNGTDIDGTDIHGTDVNGTDVQLVPLEVRVVDPLGCAVGVFDLDLLALVRHRFVSSRRKPHDRHLTHPTCVRR